MEVVHLPPRMVPLLDALQAGEPDLDPALEGFEAEREAAARWLEFHRAYSLDARDEEDLATIELLLREVESALDDLSLQRLLPPLYQVLGLMEKVGQRRDQPHFSQQPGVNDFILAAAAWVQGRGEERGVRERLPVLEENYQNLRRLYRLRRDHLRPEVRPELESGLRHFKASLPECQQALEAGDREALHAALARLGQASELLQCLLDWDRQDQLRHEVRHRRFNIPMAGPDLELALETARSVPREEWDRGVRSLTRLVLPRLLSFWNLVRPLLVLPPEQRPLPEEVDGALEGLELAVDNMVSRDLTAEQALADLEKACELLHKRFSEVERHARRGDRLQGTPAGVYWQAAMGLLNGTVPLAALEGLLRTVPPVAGVGPLMREYLACRDPELLREALFLLSSQVETEERPATSWGCGYCGHVNPLGQHPCRRCGASPSAAAGWEA